MKLLQGTLPRTARTAAFRWFRDLELALLIIIPYVIYPQTQNPIPIIKATALW